MVVSLPVDRRLLFVVLASGVLLATATGCRFPEGPYSCQSPSDCDLEAGERCDLEINRCVMDSTGQAGVPDDSTSTLRTNLDSATANGRDVIVLLVRIRDANGSAIPGITVDLRSTGSGNSFAPRDWFSNEDGLYEAEMASTVAEGKTVFASVDGGAFELSIDVIFRPGPAHSLVPASESHRSGRVAEGVEEPLVVRVLDEHGNGVVNHEVSFAIVTDPAPPASDASLSLETAQTNPGGFAETNLTLGSRMGAYQVRAKATGIDETVDFSATASPGPAHLLREVSGTGQSGAVTEQLDEEFVVEILDVYENPVPGIEVLFDVTNPPDESTGHQLSAESVVTNQSGRAQSRLTLGTKAGTYTVSAEVIGSLDGGGIVAFTATATPGPAHSIVATSGTGQTGEVFTSILDPLRVRIQDEHGNGIEAHPVSFAMADDPAPPASDASLSTTEAETDLNGFAETRLTLGTRAGLYQVVAGANDIGEPITISATAIPGPAHLLQAVFGDAQTQPVTTQLNEAFVVEILDMYENLVPGHEVLFAVTSRPDESTGDRLTPESVVTDQSGRAQSTLTLGTRAGAYTVSAAAVGSLEGVGSVSFSATATPAEARSIVTVSGSGQAAEVFTDLPWPFKTQVQDEHGNGISDHPVSFAIVQVPEPPASDASLSTTTAVTGPNGFAETHLTLGTRTGDYGVDATAETVDGTATFVANATAGAAQLLAKVSGDGQSSLPTNQLDQPFVVHVLDEYGNAVAGHDIFFDIIGHPANASAHALTTQDAVTGVDGRAATLLTLGDAPGHYEVSATASGSLSGSSVSFTASAFGIELLFPARTWPGNPVGLEMEILGAGFDASTEIIWDVNGDERILSPSIMKEGSLVVPLSPDLFDRSPGAIPIVLERGSLRSAALDFVLGGVLPDTGLSICSNQSTRIDCPDPSEPFSGQDAQFGWDLFVTQAKRFTRHEGSEPLVFDHVTQLEWQGCAVGLQGNDCLSGEALSRNWQEANNYCASLMWGGRDDWRLPTIHQISGIVHSEKENPSIDETLFPATPSYAAHWSSSFHSAELNNAWVLEFDTGRPNLTGKTQSRLFRCVRGAGDPPSPLHRSEPRPDEHAGEWVVRDSNTGLMWQGCSAGQSGSACDNGGLLDMGWEEALAYCAGVDWAGHTDWRLPNRNEAQSKVDYETAIPAVDASAFPNTPNNQYWTSTSYGASPWVWVLVTDRGHIDVSSKTAFGNVRCVRGQAGTAFMPLAPRVELLSPGRIFPYYGNDLELTVFGENFENDARVIWDSRGAEVVLTPSSVETGRILVLLPFSLLDSPARKVPVVVEQGGVRSAAIAFTIGGVLPDTGQDNCYDNTSWMACPNEGSAFYGQDAQFGWDLFMTQAGRFDRYEPTGHQPVVFDRLTQLEWQGCIAGTTGTICDIGMGSSRSWVLAREYCDTLSWAGHDDWELPTIEALSSILNSRGSSPAVNATYFPGTPTWDMWSATSSAGQSGSAWSVHFEFGLIREVLTSHNGHVRCVRGQAEEEKRRLRLEPEPASHSGDWVVSDMSTGLMWQGCPAGTSGSECEIGSPTEMSWENALSHCINLVWAGDVDWRLPDRNELQSIVDYDLFGPALDPTSFPNLAGAGTFHWSSTTWPNTANHAWSVNSYYGSVGYTGKTGSALVRCVRGGTTP